MKEPLDLNLTSSVRTKLAAMAKDAGLTEVELVQILIESFVDNGGKVYTGDWKEGPGLRVLPDWPRFSSGVVKFKKNASSGLKEGIS